MICLIDAIPIDLIEIIIVFTRDYETYKQIKSIESKLKNNERKCRIRDKLTTLDRYSNSLFDYIYKLDGLDHREYDRPQTFNEYNSRFISFFIWKYKNKYIRKGNLPCSISCQGERTFTNTRYSRFGVSIDKSAYMIYDWVLLNSDTVTIYDNGDRVFSHSNSKRYTRKNHLYLTFIEGECD